MNFLKICQKANQYCGYQNTIEAVSGLSGEQARLVDYVKDAYIDIQVDRPWRFRYNTLIHVPTIAEPNMSSDDVLTWDMILYDTRPLKYYDYDTWLQLDHTNSDRPWRYTIVPETNQILFNPLDKDTYEITARYVRVIDELENSTDTPILPASYHLLIAYKAAADFASYLGDFGTEDKYMTKYDTMWGQMSRTHNPKRTMRPKKKFFTTGARFI